MEIDTIATEIKATDIEGLRIGQAKREKGKTGVTVLLFDQPATGGVDISGGGPASRETPLLSPLTANNPIHAVVLSGVRPDRDLAKGRSAMWSEKYAYRPEAGQDAPVL